MEASRSTGHRVLPLLAEATETLARAGVESPALDAMVLLGAVLDIDRSKLLNGSLALDEQSTSRFNDFIRRRAGREPLAYIVGHKEFFSLDFEVNSRVLIPRPETELVVETALSVLSERPRAIALDLGTGSGAIAVAIAVNAPDARVIATDISTEALAVARRNAERLGCSSRVELGAGDWWSALPCSHPKFDLIVSNPPYVTESELARLEPEVGRFEPAAALMGGTDGLESYRRIAREVSGHLAPGGEIVVEVGAGQARAVAGLLGEAGCRVIEVLRDLAGHQRVVRAGLAS